MSKLAYRPALGLTGSALYQLVEFATETDQDSEPVELQLVRDIGRGEFFKPLNQSAVGCAQLLPGGLFLQVCPLFDPIKIRFC